MATSTIFVSLRPSPFNISKPHQQQPPPALLFNPTLIPKPSKTPTLKLRAESRGFGSTSNPNKSTKQLEEPEPTKNDDEDEIPQVVIERMSVRIVASVLMPMGLGLTLLAGFGALKDQNVGVPFWAPVATSFLAFGASALGIAYGALSSSWDPERKGSFFGVEELERNWVELWKE